MALECRPGDCLAYADSPNYCPHDLEPDARLTAMWLWTLRTDPSGTNGNGSPEEEAEEDQEAEDEDLQDRPFAGGGYSIESDAARRSPRGWGPISTP